MDPVTVVRICLVGLAIIGIGGITAACLYRNGWNQCRVDLVREKQRFAGTVILPPGKIKGLENRNAALTNELCKQQQKVREQEIEIVQLKNVCKSLDSKDRSLTAIEAELAQKTQALQDQQATLDELHRKLEAERKRANSISRRLVRCQIALDEDEALGERPGIACRSSEGGTTWNAEGVSE